MRRKDMLSNPHSAALPLRLPLVFLAALAWLAVVGLLPSSDSRQTLWAEDEVELPEPEEVELTTRDGLRMAATFYPSDQGKRAVPVIIIHEWRSDRRKYRDLAMYLQTQGRAVLVPDLRGHGGSTNFEDGRRPIAADRLRPADFEAMVRQDLEECKRFLMQRNNAGELNIEKLCLVGSEMGAVLAVHFAFNDWSWTQLPNLKQGQDVRGVAMISPPLNFRGLSITNWLNESAGMNVRQREAARYLRNEMSVMMLVGEGDSSAMRDASRLNDIFSRQRPRLDERELAEKQTVYFFPKDTRLQGERLLDEEQFQLERFINAFITARLDNQSYPWTDRTRP